MDEKRRPLDALDRRLDELLASAPGRDAGWFFSASALRDSRLRWVASEPLSRRAGLSIASRVAALPLGGIRRIPDDRRC